MLPPPDIYTAVFYAAKMKDNPFVREYMEKSYANGFVLKDSEPMYSADLQDMMETDSLYFDNPINMLLINRELAMQYFKDVRFEQFLHRNLITEKQVSDQPYKVADRQGYVHDSTRLFQLLMKQQPSSKDDYISDQVYSILGIQGYPFLSLKKMILNIHKRIENLAMKAISQHYDLVTMTFYKSSKCTLANNLTTAVLMYDIWQNMQM